MPSVAFDANAVGQIATYVAPGFLALAGYRTRYPRPSMQAGELLIVSVVASLPFVAGVQAVLPGTQRANDLGYVAILLATAAAVGYVVALIRGTDRIKRILAGLGYHLQPEGTIYAQTLRRLPDDGTVIVELKDGRRIWGCPRNGPQSHDDGINELYIVYPQAAVEDDEWQPVGAGVIVPIAEINTIVLSNDPTGSPPPRED